MTVGVGSRDLDMCHGPLIMDFTAFSFLQSR